MVDFGKVTKAAMLPTGILIILGIAASILYAIPFLGGALACLTGIPLFLVQIAILGWAGFKAVKEEGLDLVGGVVVGTAAGAVSALVVAIVGFVIRLLGIGVIAATGNTFAAATGGIAIILGIIIAPILGAIMGAVCGLVGALIAGQGSGTQAKK